MDFFVKSHGLGNDYIVLEEKSLSFKLTPEAARLLCDRNLGIGSDGILLLVESGKSDFGLKIFNPDGSEAEKSGNGLRIFAKFLRDYKHTNSDSFSVETPGGIVRAEIQSENGPVSFIKVEMGKAVFDAAEIPVSGGFSGDVVGEKIEADGKRFEFTAVSIGNPHCVIFTEKPSETQTRQFGPALENHEFFPNRTNVQFARAAAENLLEIFIWERGAGYTLASGSSSCAAAAAAVKNGLCENRLTVSMPGGTLDIEVGTDFEIRMTGPAEEVASGSLSAGILRKLSAQQTE
ncbi:MAG: diaminopimelate epimerase [Candidatus Mycalebacterium zealandia]|nr:MAG: diaminopimelate epimerase [Candidatus Mycalebacterium zealandia]